MRAVIMPYDFVSAHLATYSVRICAILIGFGVFFDIASLALGFGKAEMRQASGQLQEVGYLWHLHMSIWHAFVLPLMLIACGQFYRLKEGAIKQFAEVCTLPSHADGHLSPLGQASSWFHPKDDPTAKEDVEQSSEEVRRRWTWKRFRRYTPISAISFLVVATLLWSLYTSNMWNEYHLQGNNGWSQISLHPDHYSLTYRSEFLSLEPIFVIAIYFWAQASLTFLLHYAVSFLEFLACALPLFPRPGTKATYNLNDAEGYYGISNAIMSFESVQWITAGLLCLVTLHALSHAGGGHGTARTAVQIYVGSLVPLVLFFVVPMIVVMDDVRRWVAEQDKPITVRQSLRPRYSDATRTMIASATVALVTALTGPSITAAGLATLVGSIGWWDKLLPQAKN